MHEACNKAEEETKELKACAFDLNHEIECGQSKQKMFNEHIKDLKTRVDKLEEEMHEDIEHFK